MKHDFIEIDPAIQSVYSDSGSCEDIPPQILMSTPVALSTEEVLPPSFEEQMEDEALANQQRIDDIQEQIYFYYYCSHQMQE